MLDGQPFPAPQFQHETEGSALPACSSILSASPLDVLSLPLQAASALGAMMVMPLQIAMAMPQVLLAESTNCSTLRHLAWRRARERGGR